MRKGATEERAGASPSRLIDARIKELRDWRGEMLARIRALIRQADPDVIEEWKWRGVPVWSHADWGSVDCRVLAVEPNRTLSYSWAAYGLENIDTWTLTPTGTGTRLRMEQSGFRADQQQAYQGAQYGWQKFLASLEGVVVGLDEQ